MDDGATKEGLVATFEAFVFPELPRATRTLCTMNLFHANWRKTRDVFLLESSIIDTFVLFRKTINEACSDLIVEAKRHEFIYFFDKD